MGQIEEIKSKTDIVNLICEYIPLKKAGRNFKARCPFHQEKTPSFVVSPELQIFKCFGCGEGGDAIKFLQLYERMDFWEAAQELAKKAGVKLNRVKVGKDEELKKKIYSLNNSVLDFYHFLLMNHDLGKKALRYAFSRGLKKETLEKFKIGFSPLDPAASARFLIKKRGFGTEELVKSGLVFEPRLRHGSASAFFDRFHGRLIFPLLDHRGNVVSFAGRIIPGLLPNENKRGKYINGPETVVYHKSRHLYGLWLTKKAIKTADQAVLVEGELDMISSWQAGVKNVVAAKGTALTIDQIKLVKRFASSLKLALDADFAGDRAVFRGIKLAEKEGLDLYVASMPAGFNDPDQLARHDPAGLKRVFKKTVPVWDFIIASSIDEYGADDSLAKKRILNKVLPLFAQIENEVVKHDYYKKLAQALETDLEAILTEAAKVKTGFRERFLPSDNEEAKTEADREVILEEYLMALILLKGQPKKFVNLEFTNFVLKRIWEKMKMFLKEKKRFRPEKFLSFLPLELRPTLEKVFLEYGDKKVKNMENEIGKTVKELKKVRLEKKLEIISRKIAQREEKGDDDDTDRLKNEFIRLRRALFDLSEAK